MTKAMRVAPLLAAGAMEPRTFEDHFGDFLNVKGFGAAGDGVTDDTAALQAALVAAFGDLDNPHHENNARLNKPLYFPAGTYRVTAPLHASALQSGWIFGDGSYSTVIVYDGPTGTVMPTFTVNMTGTRVASVTVNTVGEGFPPDNHYKLGFTEPSGMEIRGSGTIITAVDGRITQATVTVENGGKYTGSAPTAIINACTPLMRFNGMRFSMMEGICFDMPAATLASSTTCCVMTDRWKLPSTTAHQNTFNDVATKNATYGWLIGFSGDTGTQCHGTSVSSLTIGTGSKAFVFSAFNVGGAVIGQRVRIASVASPGNWMEGQITAYNGVFNATVDVDKTNGSGTFASWTVDTSRYVGYGLLGSEHLFVNCNCTDHDISGMHTCGANCLSQNVYGGVFTRIGNAARAAANPSEQVIGGAALNCSSSGSFTYVEGATFIESRNCDYWGEGETGVAFQNITSINSSTATYGAGDPSSTKGNFFGRFPQNVILRNVRHTNVDRGAGQVLFWFYQTGTILEGCTFSYGQQHGDTNALIYSRASKYQNADPFLRSDNIVVEET